MKIGDRVKIIGDMSGMTDGVTIGHFGEVELDDIEEDTCLVQLENGKGKWFYPRENLELVDAREFNLNFLEAMKLVMDGRSVVFSNNLGHTWRLDKEVAMGQTLGYYMGREYRVVDDRIDSLDSLEEMRVAYFQGIEVYKDDSGDWRYEDNDDLIDTTSINSTMLNKRYWRTRC